MLGSVRCRGEFNEVFVGEGVGLGFWCGAVLGELLVGVVVVGVGLGNWGRWWSGLKLGHIAWKVVRLGEGLIKGAVIGHCFFKVGREGFVVWAAGHQVSVAST